MVTNTLKEWRIACPTSELGLVFPSVRGRVVSPAKLHQAWHALLEAAGLPSYGFHCLRHVAASLFIEQGIQAKRIQEILGHASIVQTYDRYGHLFPCAEDDQEAMRQIEARLLR
jgi:integrase